MKIVVLGFFLLLTFLLLAYYTGAGQLISSFTGATVQAGYMLSGRNTKGQVMGYPNTTTTPATGGSNPTACPPHQTSVHGICIDVCINPLDPSCWSF